MSKQEYTGINIQWPISEDIVSGKKTIETRTYPIPQKYLNQKMVLVETPGKHGVFKARITAIIIFTDCFKYQSKKDFYKDSSKHLVTKGSKWAWRDKAKWAWKVEVVKKLKTPVICKTKGIIYRKNILI